ncbi:MAG: imidazolonepropionase [Gemmatimonadetes bacterium]|nr:imidazolonepropionase [Gemmatimonadota bacterium]
MTHADGAILQGTATLNLLGATIVAFDGDVNPGTSPGILAITGNLPQSAVSTYNIALNGTVAMRYESSDTYLHVAPMFHLADASSTFAFTMIGAAQDITAEVEAQAAFRDSEAKLRTLFEQVPVGIAQVSLEGRCLRANPWLCTLLGQSETALQQRTLLDLTHRRLARLLAHGTTTVEVKSGYGLATDVELRQLDVIGAVMREGRPAIVGTFLGAHEFPLEYRSQRAAYVELVAHEMLPAAARQGVARYCDVFCEPGVFTVEESRCVLEAARRLGLGLKAHADELDGSGGAELAVELGAVSADHLAQVSDTGIKALAGSDTVAVLLPGTQLFLGRDARAPARRLIDAGAAVALATDFNPGSSPGMSLPLMATLGVSQLGMVPAEAIFAITVNGAAAVGEAGTRGQIAPGFRADLALARLRDWRELVYWYGVNLVTEVWVAGSPCHPAEQPVNSLV